MPVTPASSGQINRFSPLKLKTISNWTALLVSVIISTLVLSACGPNPTNVPQPTPTESSNLKISSVLLNIFLTYQTAPGSEQDKQNAAIQYARSIQVVNSKDEAIFEVEVDQADREQAIKDKIKSMGGIVRNSVNIEGTIKMRVAVPITAFINYTSTGNKDNFLQDLAAFQGIKSIDLVVGVDAMDFSKMPQTEEALTQLAQVSKNEGVKLMGADKWQAAGFKGKGAKIGVIDEGFKYYKKFLGTTLPANLEIKDIDAAEGGPGVVDDDVHGTAVLEIIYSLAPEANFVVTAVDGSDGQLKQAIDYLVSQNVNVISASLGGHGTAGDGSDPLDQYITRLRNEKGIVFLFSAGNEGYAHYANFFNPDADGFHQFIPGVTRMAWGNPSSTPQDTTLILNWEQWGLTKKQVNDLDIFITDTDGKTVVTSSSNAQSNLPPREIIRIKMQARHVYYVRIRQKPGTTPYTTPFRLHLFGHNTALQFIVPQMAVADPADSKGALAVGAIQWNEDRLANYSSQGPLPDGRFKPEISAPAGVSSRAYSEEGQSVFDGTSAACPEAAGVAILLKGANPNLTADQLETLLKTSVKDLSPAGPDYANGYGRINIGDLTPSSSIVPTRTPPTIPQVDMTRLQFPVRVLSASFYPAPVVDSPVVSKIAPSPLPTQSTRLENGATDFSMPGFSGSGKTAEPTPTSGSKPVPTRTPVPLPTRTPRPGTTLPPATPTAEVPAPPVASATFKDNFRDTTSGLPNKDNTTYQNGSYHLKASPGQLNWGSYPPQLLSVTDFSAEVQVGGIDNRNGIYGLIFWQQDASNYYLLSLTGTGQYQISQFNGGTYKEVIGWTTTTGWKAGATNNLRVVASQGTVTVSINDQPGKAGQATGQGAIGFAAGSYTGPVEASFTDFRLSSGK